jgi:hypothetical protein
VAEAVIQYGIVAWRALNISIANGIPGSQTGSQRPQIQSYTRLLLATTVPAKQHVGRHLALCGDTSKVPPKQ